MKRGWWVVGAVAVVVVALMAWNATRPEATVEVVRPVRHPIRAFVEEQARTELPQDYLIAMPISGWLEPILLREGDAVTAGQVVAHLDTADIASRVEQIEHRIAALDADLRKNADNRLEDHMLVQVEAVVKAMDETVAASEAKLDAMAAIVDFTQEELRRMKAVSEADAAATKELLAAETEYRRAVAEHRSDALELAAHKTLQAVSYIGPQFVRDYVDQKKFKHERIQNELAEARAALEMEKRNLERAEMTSPVDGVVLQRHQTRRQYLTAGAPLLTIGRLDEMEVIAEVLTERATRIDPGAAVEVYGEAMTNGPIPGRVLRVYPMGFESISSLGVEQQRVNVAIGLDERPPRLGAQFRVNVRIIYDEAAGALTLPRTALYRGKDGGWRVMTVDGGVTREHEITVGIMNDDEAQIVSGLDQGASVLARPSREIEAGMRVAVETRE